MRRCTVGIVCAVGLEGFAALGAPATALEVHAAGSLESALREIAVAYERTTAEGQRMTLEFGPSGRLAAKIEAGTRADVFASANLVHPRALVAAGIAHGQFRVFASNAHIRASAAHCRHVRGDSPGARRHCRCRRAETATRSYSGRGFRTSS